jgi:malonate transporter
LRTRPDQYRQLQIGLTDQVECQLLITLAIASGLDHRSIVAAVVCSALPTAKTADILSGEYRVEETLVASTISVSTLVSIVTLVAWLAVLA